MQNDIEISAKEKQGFKIFLEKKLLILSLCLALFLLLSIVFISLNKSSSKDAFLLATSHISVTENNASLTMPKPDLEVDLTEYIQVSKGAVYNLYEDSALINQFDSQNINLKQIDSIYIKVTSSDKKIAIHIN